MAKAISDRIKQWFINLLMKNDPPPEVSLCNFDRLRYEIRPCDVLLVEGRSRISEVIKVITQSPWSHAMIYIGRLHDIENKALRAHVKKYYNGDLEEPLVIESLLGQGTIVSPLSHYQEDHLRICRPKGISHGDAHQVIGYAIGRLGTQYAVRHVFDLARFLLPWSILPRNFRSSLFRHHHDQQTEEICSSMLAEAFSAVKFPILPLLTKSEKEELGVQFIQRNPRLFTPSDFDYSPYFEIIKYPFIELSEQAAYRNLPWSEDDLISDDEVGVREKAKKDKDNASNDNEAA